MGTKPPGSGRQARTWDKEISLPPWPAPPPPPRGRWARTPPAPGPTLLSTTGTAQNGPDWPAPTREPETNSSASVQPRPPVRGLLAFLRAPPEARLLSCTGTAARGRGWPAPTPVAPATNCGLWPPPPPATHGWSAASAITRRRSPSTAADGACDLRQRWTGRPPAWWARQDWLAPAGRSQGKSLAGAVGRWRRRMPVA